MARFALYILFIIVTSFAAFVWQENELPARFTLQCNAEKGVCKYTKITIFGLKKQPVHFSIKTSQVRGYFEKSDYQIFGKTPEKKRMHYVVLTQYGAEQERIDISQKAYDDLRNVQSGKQDSIGAIYTGDTYKDTGSMAITFAMYCFIVGVFFIKPKSRREELLEEQNDGPFRKLLKTEFVGPSKLISLLSVKLQFLLVAIILFLMGIAGDYYMPATFVLHCETSTNLCAINDKTVFDINKSAKYFPIKESYTTSSYKNGTRRSIGYQAYYIVGKDFHKIEISKKARQDFGALQNGKMQFLHDEYFNPNYMRLLAIVWSISLVCFLCFVGMHFSKSSKDN